MEGPLLKDILHSAEQYSLYISPTPAGTPPRLVEARSQDEGTGRVVNRTEKNREAERIPPPDFIVIDGLLVTAGLLHLDRERIPAATIGIIRNHEVLSPIHDPVER